MNRATTTSLDEQAALPAAAVRLAEEFEGTCGAETIEQFLTSSYDEFAGRATVPAFLPLLAERGIDIFEEYPKPWADEVVRAADVVVSMGCGDACPVFPGKWYEEWNLDDHDGAALDAVREARDAIERRVLALVDELALPTPH